MIWIELRTEAEAEAVDAVAELFSQVGHGGVAIEEPLSETAEGDRAEVDPSRPVTVKTYLPDDGRAEETMRRVEESLWHLSQLRRIEPLQVTRLAEEDWAEAWKEFFFVQRVGERLVIKPSWRGYEPGLEEVVLELDPGMAFGTGLHPTTRMCLKACERLVRPGMRVLDLGTGSGILAMASAKLGAGSVLALDVDPVAVEVAQKNVSMNGLTDKIEVRPGSLERYHQPGQKGDEVPTVETVGMVEESTEMPRDSSRGKHSFVPREVGGFDLVLANIIASVLVDLAKGLHDAVVPGGLLVASGIIAEREEGVREALEATGLRTVETLSEGDWRTVVLQRGRA